MNDAEKYYTIKEGHKQLVHPDYHEECDLCWLIRRCDNLETHNDWLYGPMECGHPGANFSYVGSSGNIPSKNEPKSCLACRAIEEAAKKEVKYDG